MSEFNINPLLPEIFLLTLACIVLIFDLYSKDRDRQICYLISQAGFVAVILFILGDLPSARLTTFNDTFVLDTLSQYLKVTLLVIGGVAMVYGRVFMRNRRFLKGEYYSLAIFALLGMFVMVSANHLMTLYLGLELLSLPLYAMIAMERNSKLGVEAAVKYFVTGAVASGFLLYGLSFLYGITGSLSLSVIAESMTQTSDKLYLIQFTLVFVIAAIAFKLGLVPFHMWLPDVYQGAPVSVVAFLASAPKIAAFGFTIRFLVDGMAIAADIWQPLILTAAILSIGLGNLVAIAQSNLKRMLAYSGIAHMGYFILGFYSGDFGGYAAAMFYVISYALMAVAAFGLLVFLSRVGFEYETLEDLKGLGRKNPWYALMMTFVMVSMAGLPPFIGFWPKLEIFRSLVAAGHWPLAVYAVVFSLIGLFYYLRVIKVVYFDDADQVFSFLPSRSIRFAITFNCVALLILGLIPDTIYQYCLKAFGMM
ncbi:MAG: NADH-quinone oxidoreductase subunit NuoN [Gammaproteobacteria bacterium]|nr:NADH-quinone oxidoreductase subunit NuoN [Gammaproteobacteria bacterium]